MIPLSLDICDVSDSGLSSPGCKISRIVENNCTVVEAVLGKQDTQSCLDVHCMGTHIVPKPVGLHLKLICFNELRAC